MLARIRKVSRPRRSPDRRYDSDRALSRGPFRRMSCVYAVIYTLHSPRMQRLSKIGVSIARPARAAEGQRPALCAWQPCARRS